MDWMNSIVNAYGLLPDDSEKLKRLLEIFRSHEEANKTKRRYYEGHVPLQEVNLGLALPSGIAGLEISCAWGEKCVDVLAARSMFDGFVGTNGADVSGLDRIVSGNNLIAEYMKACRDELKYGCTFATLSADNQIGCKIRFHSPETAAAEWDGEKGQIGFGFAIIEAKQSKDQKTWIATHVNMYMEDYVIVLKRTDNTWQAEYLANAVGRPLMEPLVWNATSKKPFGRSRLKEPVRRLIQGYIRTIANATIGLEFATSPQKYLLGVTEDQYETVVSDKFRQYVGNIIAATANPETGEKPSFGQLAQGTIEPHVEMMRILATQFSAATGLSVTDVGVVNDANPTSSDAILAQTQTLVLLAEQLNAGNGNALYQIALMAQAIANKVPIIRLPEENRDVIAHFRNPAMPSVAVTADAAIKLASARKSFAQTDTFLEMVGFDQADIRRIKAQETRARGLALLDEIDLGGQGDNE